MSSFQWRLGRRICLPVLLACASSALAQQPATPPAVKEAKPDPEEAFRDGNALMDQKKYCDAVEKYKQGLESAPEDASFLYNGGLAAYRCGRYAVALDLWKHLKEVEPGDWQTRTKLIQTYQALGKASERDAERLELFELRKRDPNSELAKKVEYCREQFEVGGEKVMAFEEFELKGARALRYVFSVPDESEEKEKYRISLGSYDSTNAYWHETTKPTPGKEDRLFHLDGYFPWGHATFGIYFPEPTYDQVRAKVVEILQKKLNPVSTTTKPG